MESSSSSPLAAAPSQQPAAPRLVWTEAEWSARDAMLRKQAIASGTDAAAWPIVARSARNVLRTFSTSFFIVTRFLPPRKRAQVEAIYAAVRYPDEVVDSFPLTRTRKTALLDTWEQGYEAALSSNSMLRSLKDGAPAYAAAFAQVVRETEMPPEYYRAFMQAMRSDLTPRPYETLGDLIDNYIYGSAIVVGYFLCYVYGSEEPGDFERAMAASRDLGIGLQLTNFLRDVPEDQRRGRVYLPLDMLRAQGIEQLDTANPAQHEGIRRTIHEAAVIARDYYARAEANLDAFSADCRTAIRACCKVYGELNSQIAHSPDSLTQRLSVPMHQKFAVLPASKYWRLPWAYLTA